uniref:Retrovirus-related Pol polyprotein from transposon TNT 1-94-like beta-barrel domain-containing protein n=1 Tax=Tanacetum cinerariifolium TaxID=118510 RepID=A0A6L2KMT2_TANCI|nr:hypothetical protein [Tanacetum cinerariifolium]
MDQLILKSHIEKPEKFKVSDFIRWPQKMLFYLTSLHVSYVFTDSEPVDPYMVDGHNVLIEAQMADYERPFVKQVEELQIIVHEMEVESMSINSNFLVGSIIEKLPQSWKNFKLYLKPLTDDMSFEQLVLKIRVEKDNKMNKKADANSIKPNANKVPQSHIYNLRRMFISYQKVNESEPMFVGNETALNIKGKGKVILKLTSENDLVLSNVLHVPNITKNQISGPILSNKEF